MTKTIGTLTKDDLETIGKSCPPMLIALSVIAGYLGKDATVLINRQESPRVGLPNEYVKSLIEAAEWAENNGIQEVNS